jgi:hypothetical protein
MSRITASNFHGNGEKAYAPVLNMSRSLGSLLGCVGLMQITRIDGSRTGAS